MTIQQRPDNFTLGSNSTFADKLIFAGLGNYAGSDLYRNSSGYNKDGVLTTLTSASAWTYDDYLRRQTVNFSSDGHRIALPSFTSFSSTTFSISAWINQRSGTLSAAYYIFDSQTGRIGVGLYHNGITGTFACFDGVSWKYFGSRPALNTWAAVTFVISGTTATCYSDGIQSGSPQTITSRSLGGSSTTIGSRFAIATIWNTFPGQIADVLVHNRALSDIEIKQYADRSNILLSGLVVPPKRKVFNVGFQSSVSAGTVQRLNIVRDCWWLMPSGASYLIDETQSFSTYSHGLYKSLGSTDDSTYIQFCGSGTPGGSGTSYYFGRLESTNIVPNRLHVGIRASGVQTGSSATISINDMEMGNFGYWSGIALQSGVFVLTAAQKKRILDGRIGDNYDFVGIRLSNSGILDNVKLYNVEVYYSGTSWDNHTTGLPNILSSYLYPTKLGFRGDSAWLSQSGTIVDYSGYYHINVAPSSVDADISYIEQFSPPNSSTYWTGGNPGLSGGLSLYFDPSSIGSLTQITRAQMTLRMSLPPSGLYENARDTFEINGYNYRLKEDDYKEDIPGSVGSIKPRDRKYGYFIYGTGSTVEQSGFKNYTAELNFLDPNLPSGDINSIKYRTIDIFNNMEFQIVGLPSGVQLSAAELYIEYLPNDALGLYIAGKVYRCPSFVYPDSSGTQYSNLGFGGWHHIGNYDENLTFAAFYNFDETSGDLYPKASGLPWTGSFGVYKDISGVAKEPLRYNYYRNPIPIHSGITTLPTLYRDALYLGTSDNSTVIDFDKRIPLPTNDFVLYFKLYGPAESTIDGIPPLGVFFERGPGTNIYDYEIRGEIEQFGVVKFTIKTVDGLYKSVSKQILNYAQNNVNEPILIWFYCYRGNYGDIIGLKVKDGLSSYFDYDWDYTQLTTYSYRLTYPDSKTIIGSFTDVGLTPAHNIYLNEFGIADHYIDLEENVDDISIIQSYSISTDLDKQFFTSRVMNARYLGSDTSLGSGINWLVPNGSGAAEWTTTYALDSWYDTSYTKHSIYNPVTTAGTNHIVHPSAIYLEVITENSTDHPSGAYIDIDIEFDSGSTDNWKVAHFELNVPSGTETKYVKTIDSHIGMDAEPILLSDINSIVAKLKTQYVNIGSTQYNGNLSIKSLRVYFDSYCVAATGLGELDLYTYGTAATTNSNIDLFLEGCISANENIDLYVYGIGHPASGDTVPLYINADHYTYPSELGNNYKTLYINGLTPHYSSGNIPLYSWATASGVGGSSYSAPMYIFGLSRDDWIPLYITAPIGTLTTEQTLYIKGLVGESNSTLNLYTVGPSGANSDTTYLYIKGLGTTDGAIPYNTNITLYIARDSEAIDARMNLYMAQHDVQSNFDSYILGHITTQTLQIYLDDVVLDKMNNYDGSHIVGSTATNLHPLYLNRDIPTNFGGEISLKAQSNLVYNVDIPYIGLQDRTIMAWVKIPNDPSPTSPTLFGSRSLAATAGMLYFNMNRNVLRLDTRFINTTIAISSDITTMRDNQWHHIAGVMDRDDKLSMYVDGIKSPYDYNISASSTINLTNASTANFNLSYLTAAAFSGSICDARLYEYALTSDEINTIKNGGNISKSSTLNWFPNNPSHVSLYINGSGEWPNSQIKLYTHGY